jgi:hypothetical protein
MQRYSDFFRTIHDETSPAGYLGRGTHYSVLRTVVFHDPVGKPLPEGQFANFAVVWDRDHDVRVIEPILEIYRRGLLSSFVAFGEHKGLFTAILSNKLSPDIKATPFNPALLRKVEELGFSERPANCLNNENVTYVSDLVQRTEAEMLRIPNFGRRSLNEIKEALAQLKLCLGMEDVPGWSPEDIEKLRKQTTRVGFIEAEIDEITQSLIDPWTSVVWSLGGKNNPIIEDEDEKVSLYLKNLEMLWHLGIEANQQKTSAAAVSSVARHSTHTNRPITDGLLPGWTLDPSEADRSNR